MELHVCMEVIEHNTTEPKQKLTLGVNRTVIERAKDAGINISAITEELLTAITYKPNEGNYFYDVVAAYEALFDQIGRIILDYQSSSLEIGFTRNKLTGPEGSPILFHPYGGFMYTTENGENLYRLEEVIDHLYTPSKILSNLISDLIEAAEANKKRVMELETALKFVKILADNKEGISANSSY
jgi:post-segregation antitoxin (ccd killing protein)